MSRTKKQDKVKLTVRPRPQPFNAAETDGFNITATGVRRYRHAIVIQRDGVTKITVGCQHHTVAEWKRRGKNIVQSYLTGDRPRKPQLAKAPKKAFVYASNTGAERQITLTKSQQREFVKKANAQALREYAADLKSYNKKVERYAPEIKALRALIRRAETLFPTTRAAA